MKSVLKLAFAAALSLVLLASSAFAALTGTEQVYVLVPNPGGVPPISNRFVSTLAIANLTGLTGNELVYVTFQNPLLTPPIANEFVTTSQIANLNGLTGNEQVYVTFTNAGGVPPIGNEFVTTGAIHALASGGGCSNSLNLTQSCNSQYLAAGVIF